MSPIFTYIPTDAAFYVKIATSENTISNVKFQIIQIPHKCTSQWNNALYMYYNCIPLYILSS